MTEEHFHFDYTELTDQEIVALAILPKDGKTPNEEGVVFLLYNRYNPLLSAVYKKVYADNLFTYYEDCIHDLYEYLRHGNPIWSKLANFQWRSTFGTWLNITAQRRFLEIKPYLIGRLPIPPLSIDGNGNSRPVPQVQDKGIEAYEDAERKARLMEAISLLRDADQRFVVLKRLQGYNSKETAALLQKRWERHGIIKLNNQGQRVVPTAGYVDVRMQRAKENLREILTTLM